MSTSKNNLISFLTTIYLSPIYTLLYTEGSIGNKILRDGKVTLTSVDVMR